MLRRVLACGGLAAALLLAGCNGGDPGDADPSSAPSKGSPTVAADFCDRELFAPVLALDEEPSVPNGSVEDKTTETPPNYSAICNASLLAASGRAYLQIAWSPANSADETRAVVQGRADEGATVSDVADTWEYAALVTTKGGDGLSVDLVVYDEGVNYYLGVSMDEP